jgi:23S rRNA pseudouridine955/2504/2580 synthase
MNKKFIITSESLDTRLDRWFRLNVCEIPQSLIEKNIRKGNIKVNKKKPKSSYKLQKNDIVNIFKINFSPDKNKKKTEKYIPTKKELNSSNEMFIENNEDFAVINKPEGISVQSGTNSRKNIIDILRNTKEFENYKPFSVHRIDKATSGILIVAKNRNFAQFFTSLFRIRKIHKTYLAIVIGELKDKKGTFTDTLYYYEGKRETQLKAITHYKVIDSNNNYSLLLLNPVTGRKHQLRKQLLIHGVPVLGDSKYRIIGKVNKNKEFLMLHAYSIKFSITNKKYNFTAKPPIPFLKILKEKYLKMNF